MRYDVTELGHGIEIHVSEAAGIPPRFIQSLQECRSGQCDCPTDEYDKLDDMDVDASPDQVTVRLEPRSAERLDPDRIRACLEYTTREPQDQRPAAS